MIHSPECKSPRAFLTARWRNLVILSYAAKPDILTPFLPPECELDTRDGQAFVSLVAFDFLQARVLGASWPLFRNFPEINLRMYVRHRGRRGVSFIREFVPSSFVGWIARRFYNEPYHGAPMQSSVTETDGTIEVRHSLTIARRPQTLSICADKPALLPAEDSTEHFFKEHHWGYGVSRQGTLIRYRVEHDVWNVYPVRSFNLDWDWQRVYGPPWGFLQDRRPDHVLLAAGSAIRVLRQEKDPAGCTITGG